MRYTYICLQCDQEFDIIKSYKDIDAPETCPGCGSSENRRKVTGGTGFFGAGDWDKAHFSHVLGKVVKSNAEERRIALSMGMEEVGTEPPEKLHKHFENKLKEKLDFEYEKDQDKLKQVLHHMENN